MKKWAIIKTIILFISITLSNSGVYAVDGGVAPAGQQAQPGTAYPHTQPKKPWTFAVYIAADNDLRPFAANNIKQMADIGSSEFINIVVHLDIRVAGNKKITRRYYIEKNKLTHVNQEDPNTQSMDSGNADSLISCCDWAIKHYPADNYALILWNHGTGILDPQTSSGYLRVNSAELFSFNPSIQKYELNQSVGFLDFIQVANRDTRGICWDATTGNYLTNQKLEQALDYICAHQLSGGKFRMIGFDACLMSMLEVGNLIKKHAHIMVGSQQVEMGLGWPYSKILSPFSTTNLEPHEFAAHIVTTYADAYRPITNDYTQSAINLDRLNELEQNVNEVSQLLIECLYHQTNQNSKRIIKQARSRQSCTHFNEPTYIDLHHFYSNILASIPQLTLSNHEEIKALLEEKLSKGLEIIDEITFANEVGSNLSKAHGISIYFPEQRVHASYPASPFAKSNQWFNFVNLYLNH